MTTNLATAEIVSDDEEEDIGFTTITQSTPILAVNRSEKTTKAACKEVFDGITVPTSDQVKAKRIIEAKEKAKKDAQAIRPGPINPPRAPPVIPPATAQPRVPVFDPSNDDHIMEDVTVPPSKVP
ncbi:hypothetical protein BYT27DRAFT_7276652, partial [Phlegmacium glaucopus]